MAGGMEGNLLVDGGQGADFPQLLVDVGIGGYGNVEQGVPAALLVAFVNGDGFAFEQQEKGQTYADVGFHRRVDQPELVVDIVEVFGGNMGDVGKTQAGVAAEKEHVEATPEGALVV